MNPRQDAMRLKEGGWGGGGEEGRGGGSVPYSSTASASRSVSARGWNASR